MEQLEKLGRGPRRHLVGKRVKEGGMLIWLVFIHCWPAGEPEVATAQRANFRCLQFRDISSNKPCPLSTKSGSDSSTFTISSRRSQRVNQVKVEVVSSNPSYVH